MELGEDYLNLPDGPFMAAWFGIADDARKLLSPNIRSLCIERYRKLSGVSNHIGHAQKAFDNAAAKAARDTEPLDDASEAALDSIKSNGHDAEPPDWVNDVPPEGMAKATGHAISEDEPSPIESAPLDWPTLYEAGEPPARVWAEPGWVGMGHITLLVGQGGIGKTLVAQQWASSWALGQRLFNDSAGPLRTLMWCCEDDHDELWRRQLAIAAWQKQALPAYGNLTLVPRAGLSNALVVSEFGRPMFTPLIEILRQQAESTQADAVVLDNVAQLYGAGENDRHAVTFFINGLTGALRGRAVLLLAHPSKGQGSEFSGSTAWEAAARTRLYLGTKLPDEDQDDEAKEDDNIRFLCRRKANYSGKDYRRLRYADGVLVPDGAVETGGIFRAAEERMIERVVLSGLAFLARMGKFATDSERSPNFLPKLIIQHRKAEGISRGELADGMRRLMNDGRLFLGIVGKNAQRQTITGLLIRE